MSTQREVTSAGLEVFYGARQHRTPLALVLSDKTSKRGRKVLRKHLDSLCGAGAVGWNVGN